MKEVELEVQAAKATETPTMVETGDGVVDSNEPEELQCEEVDMDDPDLDPLEWSVRKVLPIPKKYFWETGNDNLDLRTRVWHRSVWFLGQALGVAEYCGEVVANLLGINESRYQYVMDSMSEGDWEKARKVNEEREREWAEVRANKEIAEETGVTQDALA